MSLFRGTTRIHQNHALRFARSNVQIGLSPPPEESPALLLKSILVPLPAILAGNSRDIAPASPLHTGGNIRIHQVREVGVQIPAKNSVQRQHRFAAQLASCTLIGLRRISEAVTEHDTPVSQR